MMPSLEELCEKVILDKPDLSKGYHREGLFVDRGSEYV